MNQGSVSVEFNDENKGYLYNNYETVQDIVENSNTNPNTSKLHVTPKVSFVFISLLGFFSIFFYKFF